MAQEQGILLDDLYGLFVGKEEQYVCPDRLHLTKEGFRLAAEQVVRVVEQALSNTK
ncbi:MAG: hypothetical protein IKS18_09665 [Lachnospiraceae bacterium]|nr:hypothetical protein [Lachnospiraceae bacterium]